MALIPLRYGAIYDTEARVRPHLDLVDENGVYNRSAIFRQALRQCRQPRTRMVKHGPGALDFDFVSYVEFDRRRLGPVLTALWRQARKQRLNAKLWRMP
jgi:hypothetical protein